MEYQDNKEHRRLHKYHKSYMGEKRWNTSAKSPGTSMQEMSRSQTTNTTRAR